MTFVNSSSILCLFNKRSLLFKLSEVILKTKGNENIKILNNEYFILHKQNEIYINDTRQNEIRNQYN